MRALIPGQVQWDDARTDFSNENYRGAALHTGLMLGEQVMTVLTFGEYQGARVATKAAEGVAAPVAKEVELTAEQAKNVARFEKKLPANAKDSLSVKSLPNDGAAAQATSPGRVPGSKAVYEKQIDSSGKTIQYTKTTYDPAGNIIHVKDKITGGVFP